MSQFLSKTFGFSGFVLPSYESRLLLLNMTTLRSRRELASALLVLDLFKGHIRCPELNDRMVENSHGYETRNRRTFMEKMHTTNYAFHNPFNECIRSFNKYASSISK